MLHNQTLLLIVEFSSSTRLTQMLGNSDLRFKITTAKYITFYGKCLEKVCKDHILLTYLWYLSRTADALYQCAPPSRYLYSWNARPLPVTAGPSPDVEPAPPTAPSSGALGNLAGSELVTRLVPCPLLWEGLVPDRLELLEAEQRWEKLLEMFSKC